MSVIVFNLPGIVMAVIAFGMAFGIGELTGNTTEGP
jgi:hypothetical protein